MPDITPDHPAVEAALDAEDRTDGPMCRDTAHYILECTLPLLTADDLRNTPAGKQLMAEGKSAGWDDALNELRKGQGMHRALAGTLATRKPNYEESL